ncbi:MAG TPA: arginine--tRNA ligase [Myxococcota bacterium]|nr:arginine--tRNA ligase [Myxococcota bacterium]
MRDEVDKLLREAAARVLREHAPEAQDLVASLSVVPPKTADHGDFASNAALVLAKALRRPPRQVAELLQRELGNGGGALERTEIAGPGFLNVFLSRSRWRDAIARVLHEGESFGRSAAGAGSEVMVEFVSANPTGPLTIGHGRNAVLGDCIARLLEATGHKVVREYYFNDAGRQMRVLAQSLRARYLQALGEDAALPEEGYQGEYLVEIARALAAEVGSSWRAADEARFKARATEAIFAEIERTLENLGVRFDSYFNEHTLFERKLVDRTLEDLRARGVVFQEAGATWLRSSGFGLERDRVLVKSSGEATYLLPDVAYHRESLARGLTRIIDVLGPDHIAQFPYVRAAVAALGGDAERIELVMYQWVNLRRGGELVKMSTRKASFVTVDEILAEVGRDVFRYFMVERRADTHLDFDVELAVERSERNPVFKIQYAHARLCSIARKAAEAGLALGDDPRALALGRIDTPEEIELAKLVERLPDVVQHAAQAREPQELARYLLELANAFNAYISDGKRHRVVSDDRELSLARLALVSAVRAALANGLGLLGVTAPERM